ncbi:hypothetical protein [Paenibacillus vini]|uniref:Uncharacterized protein n=1 Tax=Paenibacillus vini TaxID=1476024 RepID=A0ABQ4MH57_9BACL|nr:hypothetical protein [Paenibacillus vini]GIP55309.1 hypothetical protein J42TS3_43440 [Paenibacillus vini]
MNKKNKLLQNNKIVKNNKKVTTPAKRGRTEEYSVEELKKIALKIKKDINGAKLSYLKLQKLTGIGRNTWSRKIPDFIETLNNPISLPHKINSNDDVYYPNFSALVETYDGDINLLYNELNEFELQYQKKDAEVALLKEELQSLRKYKEDFSQLKIKIEKYKKQAEHYKALYEQITVASTFPHLRKELDLNHNLLNFKKNAESLSLKNLENHFPQTTKSDTASDRTNENLKIIKNMAPNLFD